MRADNGPREFWDAVARDPEGPGSSAFDPNALEARMWRIVLLVRCHDRTRGLRLAREEPQRKLLDLRLYELIVLYLSATAARGRGYSSEEAD